MKTLLLPALVFAAFAATAAQHTDEMRARYLRERAACIGGQSHQDRATCLREASAAYEEAKRARLATGATSDRFDANALLRCQTLPSQDRTECEKRIKDGKVSGSIESGGVLRELRTIVPAGQAGSGAMERR